MKRKQMMISFGAYDDDVYNFLQENKNASALVRMLVRGYMRGENISPSAPKSTLVSAPAPIQSDNSINQANMEAVVSVELKKVPENHFDYSKCGTEETAVTKNDDTNRNNLRQLDL